MAVKPITVTTLVFVFVVLNCAQVRAQATARLAAGCRTNGGGPAGSGNHGDEYRHELPVPRFTNKRVLRSAESADWFLQAGGSAAWISDICRNGIVLEVNL
jgi:hypothetical protein